MITGVAIMVIMYIVWQAGTGYIQSMVQAYNTKYTSVMTAPDEPALSASDRRIDAEQAAQAEASFSKQRSRISNKSDDIANALMVVEVLLALAALWQFANALLWPFVKFLPQQLQDVLNKGKLPRKKNDQYNRR